MEQGTKAAAEAEARPKPFSLPNGVLRKQHHHTHRPPPPAAAAAAAAAPAAAEFMYRECLKNHAASLGGHALDGCGEFMLSPTADPADPSSLRCAACGCHRNFHRRLPGPHRRDGAEDDRDGTEEEEEEEEEEEDDDDDDGEEEGEGKIPPPHHRGSRSPPPPPFHSAPHMLLALSAGLHGGLSSVPVPARPVAVPSAAVAAATSTQPRKRFRSKFSPQQKGRMQELSQRLGWRMQKRDEGLVEELCREIGVDKGVFKVWMHNNKHTFLGLARRGSNTGAGGGAQTERLSVGTNGDGSHHIGRDDARDDADGGNGHVANGSFSS